MKRMMLLIKESAVYRIVQWALRLPVVRLMTEDGYFSALWIKSAVYRGLTHHIKKILPKLPRSHFAYHSNQLAAVLCLLFLIPASLWGDFWLVLLLIPALLFICNSGDPHGAEMVFLVGCIELLFFAVLLLMLPLPAVRSLIPLLVSAGLFFVLQYSIQNVQGLYSFFLCFMLLFAFLCGIAQVQAYQAGFQMVNAAFGDSESFTEILTLFFPFAMAAALSQESASRRLIYTVILLLLSFRTVLATGSKAALIAYSVELLLFLSLCNWRYLFLVLFLTPTVTDSAIGRILEIWYSRSTHNGLFVTLANLAQDIWKNGFGLRTQPFLDLYTNTVLYNAAPPVNFFAPISRGVSYLRIALELGMVVFFFFIWYLLRLARSTVLSLFFSPKELRAAFAAGLASLVGISVSSLFSYTLLRPRNLLAYFTVIGLLAAANRLKIHAQALQPSAGKRHGAVSGD